jgi:xylose isomerase
LKDALDAGHARFRAAQTAIQGPDNDRLFQRTSRRQIRRPASTNEFAFRHYNPDEVVMGKRMEDHLRFAVAYWHSFAWPGGDPFGGQTFDRPWFGDTWRWRS